MQINNRKRYTLSDVTNNRFYQLPKFLFNPEFEGMSSDARILYSLLRDRHDLSISNNWINENNEVYLIFSRKNMEKMLGVSDKTIKKAVDQLIKHDLIDDVRLGQGRANRIFLKEVAVANTMTRRNSDSKLGEIPGLNSEKFPPNDTDSSETDFSDTFIPSPNENNVAVDNIKEDDEVKESPTKPLNEFNKILKQSNYKEFEESNVIQLALRLLFYRDKPLNISSMSIPPAQIREDLKLLEWGHISYALRDYEIQSREQEIKHPTAYLATCIYNAIFQGDFKRDSELRLNGLI